MVLRSFGLLLNVFAAFVCFCVVSGWSRLVSLCLCGSVWFSAGLCLSRCVCMVLLSFGLLSTVFAAFVCSVWFLVGLDWSGCACVVLCGLLLVCACFAAFVWFYVVLGCCQLFSLRLCVSVLFLVGLGWAR